MTLVDILHHLIADNEHVEHVQDLLDALLAHPSTHTKTSDWARATMTKTYISEVASLSSQEHGLHYLVGGITEEKLRSFEINTVSQIMSAGAPCLWELIGGLLEADGDLKSRRDKWGEQAAKKKGRPGGRTGPTAATGTDVDSQPTDERIWEFLDQSVPIIDNNEDIPEDIVELEEQREESLATMVSHIR
jgi:hypothetical protein